MTIYKRFGEKKLHMKRYCSTNLQKSLKEDARRRDYLISKHLAEKSVSMDEVYLMYRQAMKSGSQQGESEENRGRSPLIEEASE